MSDFPRLLRDIFAGAAGNAMWFILGLAAHWIYSASLHRAPLRLLLGLRDANQLKTILGAPLGIVPGTLRLERESGMPIFGLGPLMALQSMAVLLKSAYPRLTELRPIPSRFAIGERIDCDLLLLGYPAGNEVTKRVMESMSLPLQFSGHDIVDASTGQRRYSARIVNEMVATDYGMLIRAPNPFHANSAVLILAGSETYGVKAAADFLSLDNFGTIMQAPIKKPFIAALISVLVTLQWRKKSYFQAVVRCEVIGHSPQSPTLIEFLPLGPEAFSNSTKEANN